MADEDDDLPDANAPPVAAARPDDPLGQTFADAATYMKAEVATAELAKNLKELGKAFEDAAGTFGSLPILKLKKNPFKWDHPAKTPEKPPPPDWIVSGAVTMEQVQAYEERVRARAARSRSGKSASAAPDLIRFTMGATEEPTPPRDEREEE